MKSMWLLKNNLIAFFFLFVLLVGLFWSAEKLDTKESSEGRSDELWAVVMKSSRLQAVLENLEAIPGVEKVLLKSVDQDLEVLGQGLNISQEDLSELQDDFSDQFLLRILMQEKIGSHNIGLIKKYLTRSLNIEEIKIMRKSSTPKKMNESANVNLHKVIYSSAIASLSIFSIFLMLRVREYKNLLKSYQRDRYVFEKNLLVFHLLPLGLVYIGSVGFGLNIFNDLTTIPVVSFGILVVGLYLVIHKLNFMRLI